MSRTIVSTTLLTLTVLIAGVGCQPSLEAPSESSTEDEPTEVALDESAESYVRLILGIGQHDDGYVDAYYGPESYTQEIEAEALSLEALASIGRALVETLETVTTSPDQPSLEDRRRFLLRQTQSAVARIDMLQGVAFSFDEESEALYDAVAPHRDAEYFEGLLQQLDAILPGEGELSSRYNAFRDKFIIPPEKLDAVFRVAIDECKARTGAFLDLPTTESFTLEYVTDKAWSGYNWYQGSFQSLIQINTDLPIYIDRAIDLACHEGYPGHHVFNMLLEKNLVEDRGWIENAVYPLYSPQSLIAEGSANYGIQMAFPGEERTAYEAKVLFPLAGLDPERAEEFYRVMELTEGLSYAGNDAARRYLDGEITAEEAAHWLTQYALSSPERAAQRVRFFDTYRSYVINYNLGQDLVKTHVESLAAGDRDRAWEVFGELLSTQKLPSGLQKSE